MWCCSQKPTTIGDDAEPQTRLDVRNRKSLWEQLFSATGGSREKVISCMTSYSPPAERLLIRGHGDFERLGVTSSQVHDAADPSFWAYGDFPTVLASFDLPEDDKERRVMGIEGIASGAALKAAIASGEKTLKIGHLSLANLAGKITNGEWHWIDEPGCVMHTATPKPALLRQQLKTRLGITLRIFRHEKFLDQPTESVGDLIIFDINRDDVKKEVGNSNVFCQDINNYVLSPFDSLHASLRKAVDNMFDFEFKPAG
jgi:hypothetical protein